MKLETIHKILAAIKRLKEANPPKIAKKSKLRLQTVHNYVRNLANLGLITPTRQLPTNLQRPTTFYTLTPKGKEVLKTLNEVMPL